MSKTRSWWGWGNIEDALSEREIQRLTGSIATLLPDADLTEHTAPEPRDIPLAEREIIVPDSLGHISSKDHVDRICHAHGKAFRDVVRNLHGQLDNVPDLVFRPRSEQDVVDALDWCARTGVAAIPVGAGSSVVGGVEPRFGGYTGTISLNMTAMNQVVEIDETSRAARIQAGIYGPALEKALRAKGLTLRHFPQSFEFSTLGGWLATRSGGHYATGLTHIDDMTESLRIVTPAGSGESVRLPASGAGPSPDRMFLGSEGTLGVITEAWMRLQDRPRFKASASVHFTDYERAVDATRALTQSGLKPSNCRLLDPVETMINAGTASPGGMLVLGFESADHPVDTAMGRAAELCRDYDGDVRDLTDSRRGDGSTGQETSASDTWRSAFLRMPYQRDALAARSMIVETFETACTWKHFNALHEGVMKAAEEAMDSAGAPGVVSCRFTHVYPDGPAPYFGVYAAGSWGSTVSQWDEIKSAVSEAIIRSGGTITHHHAVGRDHRPWYDRQRPGPFAMALHGAKSALDPAGILNPGVLLDV